MKFHQNTIAEFRERFGGRWAAPEYRQIELYTKKKQLAFFDEEASAGVRATCAQSVEHACRLLTA